MPDRFCSHGRSMVGDCVSCRLHALMVRPGFQAREDQEAIFAAVSEIERLNKWADSFSDAQLKERSLCEERIKEIESQRDAADLALQHISIKLGGPDEWSDQGTMIAYVKRQVDDVTHGYLATKKE